MQRAPALQLLPSRCLFRASSRLASGRPRVSPLTPCHAIIFHCLSTDSGAGGEESAARPGRRQCIARTRGRGRGGGLGSLLRKKGRQRRSDSPSALSPACAWRASAHMCPGLHVTRCALAFAPQTWQCLSSLVCTKKSNR